MPLTLDKGGPGLCQEPLRIQTGILPPVSTSQRSISP